MPDSEPEPLNKAATKFLIFRNCVYNQCYLLSLYIIFILIILTNVYLSHEKVLNITIHQRKTNELPTGMAKIKLRKH